MKELPKYRPKPERPRPRQFKRTDRPVWMNLHPKTLAPIGGVAFSLVMLLVYLIMYLANTPADPVQMVIGVLLAFVLGYGVTGGFVFYVLYVAEREIPRKEQEEQLFGRRRLGTVESVQEVVEEEEQNTEESEVEELE
jgi:hypothetical protein